MPTPPEPPVRVLDLFSGAGGLSEGFKQASSRYETVRAVEFDKAAAATYTLNHGDVAYAGAIQDWLVDEDVPAADIVIGGPPCQGFSALGKNDVDDERNLLWKEYAQVVAQARPKFFVMENVPQFLRSPQYRQLQEACLAGGLLEDYDFEARILNAAQYGASQVRKRVIVIGWLRDVPAPGFPEALPGMDEPENWKSIRDVWSGLPAAVTEKALPATRIEFQGSSFPGAFVTRDLHVTRHYEPLSLERFSYIQAGQNRFAIPDRLLSPCWRGHKTGAGDVMGRLSLDKPSVTIRTEFFKPEKGRYLHPSENRAITHAEAARIQGFGWGYQWVGNKVQIARQIGNAVPVPLGKALGAHLITHMHVPI